ncbi:DUF1549 domain-containing protein [Thalassoroseus pseudoceratinae]|uniref:DUF1549 domain-containing protein n=1 Tax=Thalassoroseus pseudoceratinae TaxID=2713176 RepID=UPI0014206ED8|nr:DUF1549 domain-containing protein [Thalassoroseus pseudoceratinae]
MVRLVQLSTLLSIALCVSQSLTVHAADAKFSADDLQFFEQKIRPVLVEHCYECHSEAAAENDELKGGLLVDTRAGLLEGGDSGASVTPGDPTDGMLLDALRYETFEMPPSGPLPKSVIADFEEWIRRGAPDPRSGKPVTSVKRTIDIEAGRQHWAYQPIPHVVALPAKPNSNRTSIDALIDRRLREAEIKPFPAANARTLVRRLYFDLLGLPPTPTQIDEFVSDTSPNAYEKLVDRLLASPAFGQRWGRHWLDVVRYAESVTLRGLVQQQAWRYRDYVIDSFNADLPYNEFLKQQIAGDLLPAESLAEQRRNAIATTFLTMTDANLEDQDKEKLRMDVVDEQLTVIGSAFLGQTIGCARCHDHKFDPIPTRDYYAMAGILSNVRTLRTSNVSRWLDLPLAVTPEQQAQIDQFAERSKSLEDEIASVKKQLGKNLPKAVVVPIDSLPGIVIDDEDATYVGDWQQSTSNKPYVNNGYHHDQNEERGNKSVIYKTKLPKSGTYEVRLSVSVGSNRSTRVPVVVHSADGEHMTSINQRVRPPIDGLFHSLGKFEFTTDKPAIVTVSNTGANGVVIADAVQFLAPDLPNSIAVPESPEDKAKALAEKQRIDTLTTRLKSLEADLKNLQRQAPKQPQYMGVVEQPEITDTRINIRGNVHNLGAVAPRGFLQVASGNSTVSMPDDQSGRVQLGEWLADPSNPLPARVMANRVWHWLFGAGLVRTPDNFGKTGETPSHPELLDYLARQLINNDWSSKSLIREIVLTDAYQRSSHPPGIQENAHRMTVDPENRLLWQMNRKRLEAECILDALLCVSGEVELRHGGKTFRDGLSADYGYQYESSRRAVYWPVLRNSIPEMMQVFDGANPSLVTGRRNSSGVAPQALYLMNNSWVIGRCEAAAKSLLADHKLSDQERVQRLFEVALGRLPSSEELALSLSFLKSDSDDDADRLQRWAQLVQSVISTLDFRFVN